MIRAVLPVMQARDGGNIISGIAFAPMAYQDVVRPLKAELWDKNIRVTSATPGTAATPIC